jgi:hypothetical protein
VPAVVASELNYNARYRPKRGRGEKKPLKCTHPAAARPAILRNIAEPKAKSKITRSHEEKFTSSTLQSPLFNQPLSINHSLDSPLSQLTTLSINDCLN